MALGAVLASSRFRVQFVLAPRSPQLLSSDVAAVTSPSSTKFRHYFSRGQFGAEFGASSGELDRIRSGLAEVGLPDATVGANRLSITVDASARSLDRALAIQLIRYETTSGATFVSSNQTPTLPHSIAALMTAVIGLDTREAVDPAGLVRAASTEATTAPHTVSPRFGQTPSASCAAAIALNGGGLTPDLVASAYNEDGLYSEGDFGAASPIGVIEFSSYSASDVDNYASCFGVSPSISTVAVRSGPGSSNGESTVEAELDIEDLIGLAPAAPIVVYEGQSQSGAVTNQAAYDAYAAAVNTDAVKVIATSWGSCEGSIDNKTISAENVLFEQAALQGQSIVAAAGDEGSEDCDGTLSGAAARSLAVDDPAAQPFVTGVGGTTLTLTPSRSEVVWNTGSNNQSPGAGGGGVSSVWKMPSYQSDTPASLGVTTSPTANAACQVRGSCREVPDLSANAGTPYAIYCTVSLALCGRSGWTLLGGTSAAAPTIAALIALANSSTACAVGFAGRSPSLGFINPELYAIASSSSYPIAFNDIVSGENDLTGTNGGDFPSGVGYDLASGLGSPNAGNGSDGALVASLCAAPNLTIAAVTGDLPTPTITKLAPSKGRSIGRVRVTITGKSLDGSLSVLFGATPALSFRVVSSTKIIAIAPGGSGKVHVIVTTRAGSSIARPANIFDNLIEPTITRLAPPAGSTAGSSTVTIIGSGFRGATEVRFGTTPALRFTVRSASRLLAVVPPGRGVVLVRVTTAVGTSKSSAVARFHYR